MEDVVEVDHLPYDPQSPRVCMDEQPVPLIKETRQPLPAAPGQPEQVDDAYERNGTANIFRFTEPLTGTRHVRVTAHRTAVDWVRYAEAARVRLVCDHLNTHGIGSRYEAFPPAQARRLAARLEIHPTPKHGRWLNRAEIELSALTIPCLDRRIPDLKTRIQETTPWETRRQASPKGVAWQFSTPEASIKLKRLYPQR
jgi:DDE superfamily endonuclease